eukprot:2209264-Pyramimonas_sp.AAC.3
MTLMRMGWGDEEGGMSSKRVNGRCRESVRAGLGVVWNRAKTPRGSTGPKKSDLPQIGLLLQRWKLKYMFCIAALRANLD